MSKLSKAQRSRLPSHVYGLPEKRAYPMPDRGHAEYAIKVAAIQHARGNLSAEQYAAIHSKAMNVLHASDGGMVSLRSKNNMQRDFARHAGMSMRHMANGGAVDESAYDMQIGQQHGAGNYSLFDQSGQTKTPQQIAKDAGFPLAPQDRPVQPTRAPSGGVLDMARSFASNMLPSPVTSANATSVKYAEGGPVSLREIESRGRHGIVRGPGGPREDKVPAMLSNGEYVLPAATVAHVGKEELDNLVRETNDGREPGAHSLREHYDTGGVVEPSVIPKGQNVVTRPNWDYARAPEIDVTPSPSLRVNGNPNIPMPGVTVSPEAAAHIAANPNPGAHPGYTGASAQPTPGASAQPSATPGKTMFGTGEDWKRMGNSLRDGISNDAAASGRLAEGGTGILSRGARMVGKVAKPLAPVTGAIETASGVANGDAGKTAMGALDTAAGVGLYTPAAPAAAVYLTGRTAWDAGKSLYSHLPQSVQDKIGGTINQIGLNTGLWGSDDSGHLAYNAAHPATPQLAARPSAAARTPAPIMGDESAGLTMPNAAPQPGNAAIHSSTMDADGTQHVSVGFDPNSPTSLRDAQEAYYNAVARGPKYDPNIIINSEGRQEGRASYNQRVAEARARAMDPEYQRNRAEYDAGTVTPSLRPIPGRQPGEYAPVGSWDSLVGRKDRRMALEEARSLREDSTARRGQDITAATATYGHEISAAGNRARLMYDMGKDRRDYNFQYGKAYGTGPGTGGGEVGRAEQKAREDAAKATQDRVSSMLPTITDKDGKPIKDDATAARYAAGLNAVLGQKMEATRTHLAQNPNDAQAAAWLTKAERDGLAALDEGDIRKHVAGMQAADLAQQNHSNINPFAGTAVTSDAPIMSLRRVHRTILPDYYTTDRNPNERIPAYAIDKSGTFLTMGGQQRHDFDILKKPASLRDR